MDEATNSRVEVIASRALFWQKDAVRRLFCSDCAGRVSARRAVMLQEPRTPVEVVGYPPCPSSRYYCCGLISKARGYLPVCCAFDRRG